MELGIYLEDTSRNPVTTLTKADVKLKTHDTAIELDYTDLGNLGYGNYCLWGVNFYPQGVRLWVQGVAQGFFGVQEVGNMELKYAGFSSTAQMVSMGTMTGNLNSNIASLQSATANLSSDIASKATLSANQTYTGQNVFQAKTSLSGGTGVSDGNHFLNRNDFMNEAPYCNYNPVNASQLANKNYVDDAIISATASMTANITSLSSSLTANYFNKKTGTQYVTPPVRFDSLVNFTGYVPTCAVATNPLQGNQLANVTYVNSQVNSIMSNYAGAAYQESPNIKRLIPNGSATGTVYTTWASALGSCSDASETKQYTILVTGEGTSAQYLEMGLWGDAYVLDYCHFKGLGADVAIKGYGNFYTDFQAGAIGRIIMENLYFFFDDEGQSSTITNIVFKNCKFQNNSGTTTFINCRFEGGNMFSQSYSSADFSFNNCIGERIFSELKIPDENITGTNRIQFYTPTVLKVGTASISSNADTIYVDSLSVSGALTIGNITHTGTLTANNYADIEIGGVGYYMLLQLKV